MARRSRSSAISADHHELALREVYYIRSVVNDRETEGDDGVAAAHHQAGQYVLNDLACQSHRKKAAGGASAPGVSYSVIS